MSSFSTDDANQALVNVLGPIDILVRQALPLQTYKFSQFARVTCMVIGHQIARIVVSLFIRPQYTEF